MSYQPIIVPCATEADWHAERAKGIGASEAAALVGEHPYGLTALQLWMRKRGELGDTAAETEAMEAGKFAELMSAPWYAKRTGRHVITPQEFYGHPRAFAVIVRHPTLPLQCTPDRIAGLSADDGPRGTNPGSLQLKNADRWALEFWENDAGTTPPLAVQVQLQVELLCCGFSWGAIAAVIGGNRLRYADVQRHDGFLAKLSALAVEFWSSLSGDVAPKATAQDLEPLKRMFPRSVEGLSKELERPELLLELARHRALEKLHGDQADEYEAALKQELGPAETATIQGAKVATWKTSERHESAREARVLQLRSFRLDSSVTKAAKAALPSHASTPILPA